MKDRKELPRDSSTRKEWTAIKCQEQEKSLQVGVRSSSALRSFLGDDASDDRYNLAVPALETFSLVPIMNEGRQTATLMTNDIQSSSKSAINPRR